MPVRLADWRIAIEVGVAKLLNGDHFDFSGQRVADPNFFGDALHIPALNHVESQNLLFDQVEVRNDVLEEHVAVMVIHLVRPDDHRKVSILQCGLPVAINSKVFENAKGNSFELELWQFVVSAFEANGDGLRGVVVAVTAVVVDVTFEFVLNI